MVPDRAKVTGIVLAGGRGQRMGGEDKGLIPFRGRPLAARALDALATVADRILISANRNRAAYEAMGYPVVADATDRYEGPLAGLLAAMRAADTEYVLTVPCDAPRVSGPLLERLARALCEQDAEVASAHDGERLQPVFLLAERQLADDLEAYLAAGGRKVETWLRRHRLAVADYGDCPEFFANANTPAELAELERAADGAILRSPGDPVLKRVCIFCGSSAGRNPRYREAAEHTGRLLAERGLELVYGGGNVGLMGAVADACMAAGGRVTGVIPEALVGREVEGTPVEHNGLTRLEVVDSMHTRKARMAELADGFIALPGGFGTFEELFEILTWAQLGFHGKPIGLLDVGGYYAPLLELCDRAVAEGFLRPDNRALLIAHREPEALLDTLASYRPGRLRAWIRDESEL